MTSFYPSQVIVMMTSLELTAVIDCKAILKQNETVLYSKEDNMMTYHLFFSNKSDDELLKEQVRCYYTE